jgi:hypothetical protein
MMQGHNSKLIWVLALLAGTAAAQGGKSPSVSFAPVGLVTAQRTTQTMVNLNFRVALRDSTSTLTRRRTSS